MNESYEKLLRCRDEADRLSGGFRPELALILGSGLGGFAEKMNIKAAVNYRDIPGMPVSTVEGHVGRYLFGEVNGVPVVCMQGRVHYYEGFAMRDVVLPVRVMGLLGAKTLFLSNAAGTTDPALKTPSLMIISDHVMFGVPNPLLGENIDELGTRFPDMSTVYDPALREVLRATAREQNLPVCEGVYAQLSGPSFETPVEVRLLGKLGIQAVGMSSACEAVAARHMGMRVCGISCLANPGAGISKTPLTHAEVQEAGAQIGESFSRLVLAAIPGLYNA